MVQNMCLGMGSRLSQVVLRAAEISVAQVLIEGPDLVNCSGACESMDDMTHISIN